MTILAIDQGTTSTRGLRVDADGTATIVSVSEITQHYPAPGRVEHDPAQLLQSVRECLARCPEATRVGIDNQGESCLAWNRETGEAITPVIVWQDNRTQDTVESLANQGVETETIDRAGLPLDSYFSASKLGWIMRNVEQAESLLNQGTLGLGTTDAYFLENLTGRYQTDVTTASRTSLMNLETRQWDDKLCNLFGVPAAALPEIVPTTGDFGEVEGLPNKPRIAASVVDQQASLYGHGCRDDGDLKITFGTGAFALMVTGSTIQRAPEQGLLPTVAWQQAGACPTFALDGGVYCAGSALNWARSLGLFREWSEINTFDQPPAISRDLAFVPALSGLACPHWDRRAAGMWIGLSLDTTATDMVQAVLEGVALRAAEVVTAMAQFGRVSDRISIDGGVTANPWFCQFLADILQRQVVVQEFSELTALGTAMLAGAKHVEAADANARVYEPRREIPDAVARFADAVERCKGWR